MDMRQRLRRWAYAHPRVLVVDAPGHEALRWAVESSVDDRGWEFALSPADCDVLIVIGEADPALAEAIDVVWSQVPRPRSRVLISDPAMVNDQLDAAVHRLTSEPATQHEPPVVSPTGRLAAAGRGSGDEAHAGHDMDTGEHAGHDMGGDGDDHGPSGDGGHAGHDMDMSMSEHAGHDMGGHGDDHGPSGDGGHAGHDMDMDMGGHAGHDMGGHGMHHGGVVAGLPMAMTAQDRDGLDLDTLSVGLGPILPGWPTGLILRAQLQGDVLTDVELSWTAGAEATHAPAHPRDPQLMALDHLARFLVVAGWATATRRARRVRAGLGSADPGVRSAAQASARRLAKRIRRSHTLAWSVRGMGRLTATGAADHDVVSRVHRWCDSVAQPTDAGQIRPMRLAELEAALEGAELAAARLIVASFALDRADAHREEEAANA